MTEAVIMPKCDDDDGIIVIPEVSLATDSQLRQTDRQTTWPHLCLTFQRHLTLKTKRMTERKGHKERDRQMDNNNNNPATDLRVMTEPGYVTK